MSALMETKAGDAGAFRSFDLARVPSPCFVIDEAAVRRNCAILQDVSKRSGVRILSALKAFSAPALGETISHYLDGTCASGLFEARLGREHYQGKVTTYCAAYRSSDIAEISRLSDHLIFNSPGQIERFADLAREANSRIDIGLRINPEHSEGEVEKYDPCAPCSRLGTPVNQLGTFDFSTINGLHMHTLCEQGFEPLQRTFAAIEPQLASHLAALDWINFGGGHHITRGDYDREALIAFLIDVRSRYGVDVYLEPGEAVALDAGILVGEILDLHSNSVPLALLDISATCHMPDVIEAPYRPELMGEAPEGVPHVLGGPSCLAGDVIGTYRLHQPKIGDRLAFLDQAHYSFVKTNTFNGVPLPSIALWNSTSDELTMLRTFSYDDFRMRLP